MTITVILTDPVAIDWRDGEPSSPEAESIIGALERFDASITPMHPGVDVVALAKFFRVEMPDSGDAEALAETLRRLEGVEAAYVKPPDDLP